MSRYPSCIVCDEPCCCGERDALNRPVHLGRQSALPLEERDPRLPEHPTSYGRRWGDREEDSR